MKKIILLLLTLVACAAVSMAAADDLKDNSLQIDDSRLEKKEGLKFGLQSEQIKELFNEATQKKLQDMQQHQEEQLITERGQLFSAIQEPVKKTSEEQLFQPNSKKIAKFQTNIGQVEKSGLSDFLPEIFYIALIFLLFGATAVMSYRVMVEGMD
ncbi:type VII secretion protein EssA [Streptococcus oralis]|jgi:type VII secretion protein essA|uniref:Type VII secretion protein EssA n=2 Tax=Streptococcus oralis TaxID=1303 RepID=A0A4Q2FJF3_STROR|nr:type VII secretion protein EssA [Streptococcus oralis]MCY7076216.1 type VII secretion protein EssA [Streptococcus oralis]RXX21342.1 type VII secretion protein EssA [Streptococcus oralis]